MNDATTAELAIDADDDGWSWSLIEIMGFRKHAGRTREVEQFGAKMLRIDIPINGDPDKYGWETRFYGGSSIFSVTPTDRDSVMRANKSYEPPSRYRLPAPEDDDDGDHLDAGDLFDAGGDAPTDDEARS